MSKQQTAEQTVVDFLVAYGHIPFEIIWLAKQMEKEQIKAAYNRGYQDGEIEVLDGKNEDVKYFDDAEQYYNQTYQP